MHNNFYLLRQLATELHQQLEGAMLVECFSQNKDELILIFQKKNRNAFYIQAHLTNQFSILNFPTEFRRAKRNTISLFEELNMLAVKSVTVAQHERAFVISLAKEFQLIFKLYGNHANVAVCKSNVVKSLFKSSLKLDWELNPKTLSRAVNHSFEAFQNNEFSVKKTFFTLGNLAEQYHETLGFADLAPQEQFDMVLQTLTYLEHPQYYITKLEHKVVLSMFPIGEVLNKPATAIDALSAFYHAHFRYNFLENYRTQLLAQINRQLISSQNYVGKCQQKLQEHAAAKPWEEIANIIMANLHQIPHGSKQVTLFDFYNEIDISIDLNSKISPQDYASLLYKKARNKPLELGRINSQIEEKLSLIENLNKDKIAIEAATFYKEIEPYILKYKKVNTQLDEPEEPVFKTYELLGFKILVGRNAKNNDKLTQQYAHKDDLWLHAKDVAGSHVVVKHQAGKTFPKPVLEKAAGLAAYYSKRKNDTLCPVMYTLKKYVRKVKGSADGAVRVEREQVIMVVPSDEA